MSHCIASDGRTIVDLPPHRSLFERAPAENELFYREIQPGLDVWGTSFFCGSAALLRRSALEDIGGLATTSITG